ncbi:MAG TPA: hypothetical protein VL172_02705 [Kofleriaceae bacterium]|nr:hypothetical protein [Kofleriaceae bacterium]
MDRHLEARMVTRLLPLALAAACTAHGSAVEIRADDCVLCHRADYDGAAPPHPGHFPTTCADCHLTDGWVPALGGNHPETQFPIGSGAHAGIGCRDCHDLTAGPSTGGANTNCIGCHEHRRDVVDPIHEGIDGYGWDPSAPHFCLTCHPDGQAANHPEAAFPISSGPHSGLACTDCHDRDRGPDRDGANTDCIGCHLGVHTQGRMADAHNEVGNYSWQPDQPNFCLRCHPRGFAEGD